MRRTVLPGRRDGPAGPSYSISLPARAVPWARGFAPRRRALSLLEMILAIAILAGTFMVLGELVRIGTRAGGDARDLTEAQLICESILSEVVSGAVEPDPVNRAEVPTDPAWLYSIWLQATDEEGLVALRVTVEQNLPKKKRPRSFSLTRWIPDPGIELPEEDERDDPSIPEEENDGSGSEAGGGGDGDGGSGGGSGGGR